MEHLVSGICFFLPAYLSVRCLAPLMPKERMTTISGAALKRTMIKVLVGCSMIAGGMLGGHALWQGAAAGLGWDASFRSVLMVVGIVLGFKDFPRH